MRYKPYPESATYHLSYQELKGYYHEFLEMTDEEFMEKIHDAMHLACIIMWLKERGQHAICDEGIVHELIHLMTHPADADVQKVRDQFKEELLLS